MPTQERGYVVTVLDARQSLVVAEHFEQLAEALDYAQRLALPGRTVRLSMPKPKRRKRPRCAAAA
ncbi:MAG: hypothetical protein JRI23_36125 [Deltaproteobacteria bacterium]|jgi:hypothetical protein|nr:hypothetical protein [Deltaproteobacteria bacterium]MBW2537777.1 hypothetical protein [Deltaproteobacteria bacterium]